MKRKHEVNHRRLQMAAHLFTYTSRDGMIVSQLTQVSPLTLFNWSKTNQWKMELAFWGYDGTPFFEGEAFDREVSKSLMRRSLKKAGQLWRQLFGLTGNQNELSRFLKGRPHPFLEEKNRR